MAAVTHRMRTGDGARQELLEQLLSRQATVLQKRRHLLRDSVPSAMSGVMDFEEHSLDAEEQGVAFSVLKLTSRKLQEMQTALQRLASGAYGTCSDCGRRISGARLRALPFAALCLACQEQLDIGAVAANGRRH